MFYEHLIMLKNPENSTEKAHYIYFMENLSGKSIKEA